MQNTYMGEGIYTPSEASRLTGVPARRIRRWLRGYQYDSASGKRFSPQLWRPQLPEIEGVMALGFLDLNEIRFIDRFRQHGVPWKALRKAAVEAARVFGSSHPFSQKRFFTDGRTIFAEVAQRNGEKELYDLAKSQFAFKRILGPSLYDHLEFSKRDVVHRWWPLGRNRQVVVDPKRSFGKPIVNKEGVPTEVLADAYASTNSFLEVANWYDVAERAVRDAIAFERSLAA